LNGLPPVNFAFHVAPTQIGEEMYVMVQFRDNSSIYNLFLQPKNARLLAKCIVDESEKAEKAIVLPGVGSLTDAINKANKPS